MGCTVSSQDVRVVPTRTSQSKVQHGPPYPLSPRTTVTPLPVANANANAKAHRSQVGVAGSAINNKEHPVSNEQDRPPVSKHKWISATMWGTGKSNKRVTDGAPPQPACCNHDQHSPSVTTWASTFSSAPLTIVYSGRSPSPVCPAARGAKPVKRASDFSSCSFDDVSTPTSKPVRDTDTNAAHGGGRERQCSAPSTLMSAVERYDLDQQLAAMKFRSRHRDSSATQVPDTVDEETMSWRVNSNSSQRMASGGVLIDNEVVSWQQSQRGVTNADLAGACQRSGATVESGSHGRSVARHRDRPNLRVVPVTSVTPMALDPFSPTTFSGGGMGNIDVLHPQFSPSVGSRLTPKKPHCRRQ